MKNRRQALALRSLSRVPPSLSEAEYLHTFYLRHGRETLPNDGTERVWMGDTITEKTMLMFPQERKSVFVTFILAPQKSECLPCSVHQKVFGGYLMRLAYEVRPFS
jgi:acyl-coenzyme A thioesterase 9